MKDLVFTSAVGRFTFAEDTLLSHAQLVRDSVTGQMLHPQPNTPRINTENDAYEFVRAMDSKIIAAIEFKFELN